MVLNKLWGGLTCGRNSNLEIQTKMIQTFSAAFELWKAPLVGIMEQTSTRTFCITAYRRPGWKNLSLVEQAEMLQDIRDYDDAKSALEKGDEELIPSQVVYAILDGENPIRVWREYRGMPQHELVEEA